MTTTVESLAKLPTNYFVFGKDVYVFDYAVIHPFTVLDDYVTVPPGCILMPFTHVKKTDVLTEWRIYSGPNCQDVGPNKQKDKLTKEEIRFLEALYLERLVKRRLEHG